ncbi:MAG: immunoglobulin domain-containing protein [Planctomycetota bacterium]
MRTRMHALSMLAAAAAASADGQLGEWFVAAEGEISATNDSIWNAGVGDRYRVEYDLDLTGLLNGGNPAVYEGTATITLTVADEPPLVLTDLCLVRVGNPGGVPQISFVFNNNDPAVPDTRLFDLTLLGEPGQPIFSPFEPPLVSDVALASPTLNALNSRAFEAIDDQQTATLSANADAFEAFLVDDPPQITAQPAAATIADPNDTVVLTVGAVGPGLQYQWRRDGVPLSDGPNIDGAATATLSIDAQPIDTGVYDCVVSNVNGSVTTAEAALGVRTACPADQNFDGFVTPADFNAWVLNFNSGC